MIMWKSAKCRPRTGVEDDKVREQLPKLCHSLLLCLHQQLLPGLLLLCRKLLLQHDPLVLSVLLALQTLLLFRCRQSSRVEKLCDAALTVWWCCRLLLLSNTWLPNVKPLRLSTRLML
jgi:hypothetical protein